MRRSVSSMDRVPFVEEGSRRTFLSAFSYVAKSPNPGGGNKEAAPEVVQKWKI
jgi:hypothetical protein